MPRIRTMGAGLGGSTAKNLNVNGNTGGGNKKQGLATTTNTGVSFASNAIKNKAYGENRDFIFCVNQLGGIGGKSKMFATTADGVKDCVEGPVCPVKEVTHAYLTAFGRHPDASGIKTYCDNFRKKNWTLEMIITDLVNSVPEGQNMLADITPAFGTLLAMVDVERFDGDFTANLRNHIVSRLANSSTGPLALSPSEISSALTITPQGNNLEEVVGRWTVDYTFSYEHSVYGLISGSGDLFVYVVDTTSPTIVSIELFAGINTPVQTNYGIGQVMNIRATFSEDVSAIGLNPTLLLSNGAVATYSSGVDNIFEFEYTVVSGDNGVDGLVDLYAVGFGGGQITDDQGSFQGHQSLDLDVGEFFGGDGHYLGVAVDSASPSMAITSTTAGVSNGFHNGPVGLVFTASEDITGFAVGDISLSGGSLSNFDDSNAPVYTATFTPTAGFEGACSVSVAIGAITDPTGNPNTVASNTFTWTNDTTAPTMTITGPTVGSTINSTSVDLTFTASEDITDFGINNITVSNGSLDVNSFDDTNAPVYNATFTPSGNGQCTVDVSTFTDLAGNTAEPVPQLSWIFDGTTPNIQNITVGGSGPFGIGNTVSFTATFNEPVFIITWPALNLSNSAVANYSSGSGTDTLNFTYQVASGESDNNLEVTSVAGTIKDVAGNVLSDAIPNQTPVQVDATRPTMEISSSDVSVNGFHNGDVDLVFTASEDLDNFQESDITVTNGSFNGTFNDTNAPVYTATFTPTAEDVCSVSVAIGAITDLVGNDNTASSTFTWTNDTTAPTLTNLSSNANSYGIGHIIEITAKFSEVVNVTGTPLINLLLEQGLQNTSAVANYSSGSGTDTLIFTYEVISGTMNSATLTVTDLNVPANENSNNPSTFIQDIAGNNFTFGTSPGNNLSNVSVDAVSPSMIISSTTAGVSNGSHNGPVVLVFTASEDTTDFVEDDISLSGGSLSNFAADPNDPLKRGTATFTPSAEGVCSISVAANKFTDAVGNVNSASNTFNWTYDNTPPTLDGVSYVSGNTGVSGAIVSDTVLFTANFSKLVNVTGTPELLLSNGAVATYSTGSNTDSLVFTYQVAAFTGGVVGTNSSNLSIVGSGSVGSIKDAAGNSFTIPNLAPLSLGISVDATIPIMTISSLTVQNTGSTNDSQIIIQVSSTENIYVNGVLGAPVLLLDPVAKGTISAPSGAGASYFYTFTVSPNANLTSTGQVYSISVTNNPTDAAGNPNTVNSFSWTYDSEAPQPTISVSTSNIVPVSDGGFTNEPALDITFNTGEVTTNFVSNDITIQGGGSLTNFTSVNQSEYTADFSANSNGVQKLIIPAGVFTDAAGNNNIQIEYTWTYDSVPPFLANITLTGATGGTFGGIQHAKIGDNLDIALTFSEAVTLGSGLLPSLSNGGVLTLHGGNGSPSLVFRYTVISGTQYNTSSLEISPGNVGSSLTDLAGNSWTVGNQNNFFNGAGAAGGWSTNNGHTLGFAVDSTAPTMTITSTTPVNGTALSSGGHANGDVVLVFTASEDTTDFAVGDITVTNGSFNDAQGASTFQATSASEYTATFTPTAGFEGACSVSVAANKFTDRAGNDNTGLDPLGASSSFNWTNDTTAPTMTITSTTLVNGTALSDGGSASGVVDLVFTASEDITDFVEGDISVTENGVAVTGSFNGTLTADPNGQVKIYTATFTPTTGFEGACSVSVVANKFKDLAGNQNTGLDALGASSEFNWTNDTTEPTMTITAFSSVLGTSVNNNGYASGLVAFTFTPSEDLDNFQESDITVSNNGTLNNFQGPDANTGAYTADFTPTANGDVCSVSVAIGAITDLAGNQNTVASTAFTWTNDTMPPTMTISPSLTNSGIFSVNGVNGYGNTQSIQLIIESSEVSSSALAFSDLIITPGLPNAAINASSLNQLTSKEYLLIIDGSTALTAGTPATYNISVPANAIQDLAGNDNTASNTFTWNFDDTDPSITGAQLTSTLPSGKSAYGIDDHIEITITYDEVVSAGSGATIGLVGDDASNTFREAVYYNGNGTTLKYRYTVTSSDPEATFTLNGSAGGTPTDRAGNSDYDLNAAGGPFQITGCDINGTAPNMSITSTTTVNGTALSDGGSASGVVALVFTPSADTTNFVVGDITVSNNGTLNNFQGPDANTGAYTADFTPSADGPCSVSVGAGVFTNTAGNQNTASSFNWTNDTTGPTMVITSTTVTSGATTNDASIDLVFTASENTTNFAVANITLGGGSLSNFAATPVGQEKIYTATFTPTANGLCSISVAANTFTDVVGNDNTASNLFSWTFDNTLPAVEGNSAGVISINAPAGTYGVNNTLEMDITVVFTEAIFSGGLNGAFNPSSQQASNYPTLELSNGGIAVLDSISALTAVFKYTPSSTANSSSTVSVVNLVTPSNTSLTDLAGNPIAGNSGTYPTLKTNQPNPPFGAQFTGVIIA